MGPPTLSNMRPPTPSNMRPPTWSYMRRPTPLLVVVVLCLGSISAMRSVHAQEEVDLLQQPRNIRIGTLIPQVDGQFGFAEGIPAGIMLAVKVARLNPMYASLNFTIVKGNTLGRADVGEILTLSLAGVDTQMRPVEDRVDVVIGPSVSDAAIHSALIGNSYGLPLISPSASSPALSQDIYGTFSRVYASDEFQGIAVAELLRSLGISAVAILRTTDNYSALLAQSFGDAATDLNRSESERIEIVRELSYTPGSSDATVLDHVRTIKESGVAVIVLIVAQDHLAVQALRQFDREGMISEQYTFIGVDGWIGGVVDQGFDVPRLLHGVIGTAGFVDEQTPEYFEFIEQWMTYAEQNDEAPNPSPFAAYAYDATTLAIRAIYEYQLIGGDNQTEVSLVDMIRAIDLDGVTGRFSLDDHGDRIGDFSIFNYVYNEGGVGYMLRSVGRSLHNRSTDTDVVIDIDIPTLSDVVFPGGAGVLPGSFIPAKCETQNASFVREECNADAEWTISFEFVPDDIRRPCEEVAYDVEPRTLACDFVPYSSSYGVGLVAATCVCMVLTIGAGVIVAIYRKHNEFEQSQPAWILCTIVGAVVLQLILFASLGDNTEELCQARYALFFFGWNLLFVGVYSKAFRFNEILHHQVVWKSTKMYFTRLALPSLAQVALFIIWFGWYRPTLVDCERFVQSSVNNFNVPVLGLRKCAFSENDQYVYPTLLALNIVWLLYTVALAFRIRRLKYNKGEARSVSLSVLFILVSSAVAFPYLFTGQPGEARGQVTRSTLLVLFASTGTVMLLVVPKVWRISRPKVKTENSNVFGSLESILGNKISSHYLREYLDSLYSAESINFLDSVRRYQIFVDNPKMSDEETRQKAFSVYHAHIDESSPNQVNVSYDLCDKMRSELDALSSKKKRAPAKLFNDMVIEIKRLIYSNHYHRFLKSDTSFAAQRALEWTGKYHTMGMRLQRSIVLQMFEDYRKNQKASDKSERDKSGGIDDELSGYSLTARVDECPITPRGLRRGAGKGKGTANLAVAASAVGGRRSKSAALSTAVFTQRPATLSPSLTSMSSAKEGNPLISQSVTSSQSRSSEGNFARELQETASRNTPCSVERVTDAGAAAGEGTSVGLEGERGTSPDLEGERCASVGLKSKQGSSVGFEGEQVGATLSVPHLRRDMRTNLRLSPGTADSASVVDLEGDNNMSRSTSPYPTNTMGSMTCRVDELW